MARVQLIPVKRLEEAAELQSIAVAVLRRFRDVGLRGDVNEHLQLRSLRTMIAAASQVHGAFLQTQLAQGRLAYLEERRKGAFWDRRTKEDRYVVMREKNDVAREAIAIRREELDLRKKRLSLKRREVAVREKEHGYREDERDTTRSRVAAHDAELEAATTRLKGLAKAAAPDRPELGTCPGVPGAGVGVGAVDADADGVATGAGGEPDAPSVSRSDSGEGAGADSAVGAGADGVGCDDGARGANDHADRVAG